MFELTLTLTPTVTNPSTCSLKETFQRQCTSKTSFPIPQIFVTELTGNHTYQSYQSYQSRIITFSLLSSRSWIYTYGIFLHEGTTNLQFSILPSDSVDTKVYTQKYPVWNRKYDTRVLVQIMHAFLILQRFTNKLSDRSSPLERSLRLDFALS